MSRTPLAFLSYVNEDDEFLHGNITKFRKELSRTVKAHRGKPFDIFQDRQDIAWGQQWQERINNSLDAVTFLIPIITPSFFNSAPCRDELERFLRHEAELGRADLILPVYYIDCPVLNDKEKLKHDPLAQIINAHQREDWRELCHYSFDTRKIRKALAEMAQQIVAALERSQDESSSSDVMRLAVAPSELVSAAEFVFVVKDGVKLYSGVETSSEVHFELPAGYPLEVISCKGDWVNVRDYEKDEGWIAASLISNTPCVIVKAEEGYIYSGPGREYNHIGKVVRKVILKRLEDKGDWVKVSHPRLTGWIAKQLVWP